MTKLAEPYPAGLCYMLAWAACSDVGILKANQSWCCKADHRRIGEAKNPGPSRAEQEHRTAAMLDAVEMIRPETEMLGHKAWMVFFFGLGACRAG